VWLIVLDTSLFILRASWRVCLLVVKANVGALSELSWIKRHLLEAYLTPYLLCSFGDAPLCRPPAHIMELVRMMHGLYKAGAQQLDSEGKLPIHIIFERDFRYPLSGAGLVELRDLAQCLIDICPNDLSVYDYDCKLPLHFACMNRVSLDAISLVLSRYSGAIHTDDSQGFLPLSYACAVGCSTGHILLLVEMGRFTTLCETHNGEMSLQLAHSSTSATTPSVEKKGS